MRIAYIGAFLQGGNVAHEFLSDGWFEAVEALGPPPPPSGPDPGPINLVVTRDAGDEVHLHIAGGAMVRASTRRPDDDDHAVRGSQVAVRQA